MQKIWRLCSLSICFFCVRFVWAKFLKLWRWNVRLFSKIYFFLYLLFFIWYCFSKCSFSKLLGAFVHSDFSGLYRPEPAVVDYAGSSCSGQLLCKRSENGVCSNTAAVGSFKVAGGVKVTLRKHASPTSGVLYEMDNSASGSSTQAPKDVYLSLTGFPVGLSCVNTTVNGKSFLLTEAKKNEDVTPL